MTTLTLAPVLSYAGPHPVQPAFERAVMQAARYWLAKGRPIAVLPCLIAPAGLPEATGNHEHDYAAVSAWLQAEYNEPWVFACLLDGWGGTIMDGQMAGLGAWPLALFGRHLAEMLERDGEFEQREGAWRLVAHEVGHVLGYIHGDGELGLQEQA